MTLLRVTLAPILRGESENGYNLLSRWYALSEILELRQTR